MVPTNQDSAGTRYSSDDDNDGLPNLLFFFFKLCFVPIGIRGSVLRIGFTFFYFKYVQYLEGSNPRCWDCSQVY